MPAPLIAGAAAASAVPTVVGAQSAVAAMLPTVEEIPAAANLATQSAKGFGQELSQLRGTLTNTTGATDQLRGRTEQYKNTILQLVATFQPFQVELFSRAVRDLMAVFGQLLVPVVQLATKYVRELADYFYSLPISLKGVTAAFGQVIEFVKPVFRAMADIVVQSIGALIAELQSLWKFLSPMLIPVLQQLRASFVNLLDALKPAIMAALASAAVVAATSIGGLTIALKLLAITVENIVITMKLLFPVFTILDMIGRQLQKTDVGNKSAFGLASYGANIGTDVGGLKTRIEEEIIKNTGGMAEDPQVTTAKNTTTIVGILEKIASGILAGVKGGGGIAGGAAAGGGGQFTGDTAEGVLSGAFFGAAGKIVLGR